MLSSGDVSLNEVYHFCTAVFNQTANFHEVSQQIAKFLFHTANHAKIKAGEFYMVFFKGVQLEGELMDAIGLFKSETKEPYLKVALEKESFHLDYEEAGINIHKLDKGCLVFNTDKEEGYRIVITDQTNRGSEAVYWKDEFLQLKIRNDDFNQTSNTLKVYKSFVTSKMDGDFEISKADKIDLLNRSIKYFKEKEYFAMEEFTEEVIGNPKAIESFKTFKQEFEKSNETEIGGEFAISASAIKKQARALKSVLKLDKNFHIYIHGNKELIEKGFDDDKAMN